MPKTPKTPETPKNQQLTTPNDESAKVAAANSYDNLHQELQTILARLEDGEVEIGQAVSLYERGLELVGQLESRLKDAENKVTQLRSRHDESNDL